MLLHTLRRRYVTALPLKGVNDFRAATYSLKERTRQRLFVSSPDIPALMLECMKSGEVQTDRSQLPPLQFR